MGVYGKMAMKSYIVYDSRAEYDVDEAQILEVVGESNNEAHIVNYFKSAYDEGEGVLFAYDVDGEDLTNGQQVYTNEL